MVLHSVQPPIHHFSSFTPSPLTPHVNLWCPHSFLRMRLEDFRLRVSPEDRAMVTIETVILVGTLVVSQVRDRIWIQLVKPGGEWNGQHIKALTKWRQFADDIFKRSRGRREIFVFWLKFHWNLFLRWHNSALAATVICWLYPTLNNFYLIFFILYMRHSALMICNIGAETKWLPSLKILSRCLIV